MRTALTIALVLAGTSAYACGFSKTVKLEQSVASLETVKTDEKVEEAVTTTEAKVDETDD